METIDMAQTPLRELNAALQAQAKFIFNWHFSCL